MRPYGLYIRKCPGVEHPTDFKVGVAALDKTRTRLAAYQQAVGPVWQEQFILFWTGEDVDVKEAETKIKRQFKNRIASSEAGLSEWISNIELKEILNFIDELVNEHFIKLTLVPSEFLPLTMDNVEDFTDWTQEGLVL
jgi:hypothetical protein